MINALQWYYAFIFLTTSFILVFIGARFFRFYGDTSTGQKCIMWAILNFTLGGWIGSIQSVYFPDQFRYGFIPHSIGIVCMLIYAAEPWDQQHKRWGQDPFAPKKDKR